MEPLPPPPKDMEEQFAPVRERLVRTNGRIGLTHVDAKRIIALLKEVTG